MRRLINIGLGTLLLLCIMILNVSAYTNMSSFRTAIQRSYNIKTGQIAIEPGGNITMGHLSWMGIGSGDGRLIFGDAATDYFLFKNGFVGIGTVVPTNRLHINVGNATPAPHTVALVGLEAINSEVVISFVSDISNSAPMGLWFGDTDATIGRIEYSNSTDRMRFGAGGHDNSLTIDNSGFIGVNVSDPDHTLEISADGVNNTTQLNISGTNAQAGFKLSPVTGDIWDVFAANNSYNSFTIYNRTDSKYCLTIDANYNITFDSGTYLRSVASGITATNPGGQGDNALTKDISEVATVGTANDAVTLPSAIIGMEVTIINNGANTLEIWPASGDNVGAGVNNATTLASGSNVTFVAYDVTNWEVK